MRALCHLRIVASLAYAAGVASCATSAPPVAAPQESHAGQHSRVPATDYNYTVLYRFAGGIDGAIPEAGLTALDPSARELYGTTSYGGSSACYGGCGTVFKISRLGVEKVLYRFSAGTDGAHPRAALIAANGVLYGTTSAGGSTGSACYGDGCGTAFAVTPTGEETVLYRFMGGSDGAEPEASLLDLDGTLYGTTFSGGNADEGTIFKMTPSGTETVLYRFTIGDGAHPEAGLAELNGDLYGTALLGGPRGGGTLFKVKGSGEFSVVHSFGSPKDGDAPAGGVLAVNGELIGTTQRGGNNDDGIVFDIAPSGEEHKLFDFDDDRNGLWPSGNLITVNSVLYGVAEYGGDKSCSDAFPPGCGVVYGLSIVGQSVLHRFEGKSDGKAPRSSLVELNGELCGTTPEGGDNDNGTIFCVTP